MTTENLKKIEDARDLAVEAIRQIDYDAPGMSELQQLQDLLNEVIATWYQAASQKTQGQEPTC